jgi:beta-lactamase class D
VNPPVTRSRNRNREKQPPPGPSRPPRAQRGRLTERQRRLRQRALPLGAVALIAFIFGAISSAGSPEQDMAERFVNDWAHQDFAAMHDELSGSAQGQYSAADLQSAYLDAQEASTATSIDPGSANGPTSVAGKDVVDVRVGVGTRLFGKVDGILRLPLDGGKVAWNPSLTFPGLATDERVGRRLTVGRRAPILARHRVPLATGSVNNRTSPLGSDAIDVAGETGAPDSEEQAKLQKAGYPSNQDTGVSGLELAFNPRLSGQPSGQLLAVKVGTPLPDVPADTQGRVLATTHGTPGIPVHTTIDPRLQETTVRALGGQSGGVVVLDARNGNVLALAGSAYSSPQPPGSTFKVITTTAALENHDVKLSDTFPVVTQINPDPAAGARVVANAHNEACGGTFVQAFAKSCNSVFAPLAVKVGADNLVNTAEDYGYNQPVTLYNAQATAATQPSRMTLPTADELNAEPTHTDLSVTGFGQGKVLATPLGMASVAQTVANGGVRDPTNIVKDPNLRSAAKSVEVTSKANARVLTGLMRAVVTQGTGTQAALPGIQVAGKTGTAELGPKPGAPPAPPGAQTEQIVDGWFIAFAPANKPKLAIAVMLIDASGDGGTTAAPIARAILGSAL